MVDFYPCIEVQYFEVKCADGKLLAFRRRKGAEKDELNRLVTVLWQDLNFDVDRWIVRRSRSVRLS